MKKSFVADKLTFSVGLSVLNENNLATFRAFGYFQEMFSIEEGRIL